MAKGKQRSLIKPPKTNGSGTMKQILEASKYETVVLGKIQKHIINVEDEPRDATMLHPSAMAKQDWCPRESFYQISPDHPAPPADDIGYVLQNIFDEGHFVHSKYQGRLWDLGLLRGWFRCWYCSHRWHDTSPQACPECGAAKECVQYREIPLRSEEYWITGHADGDLALGEDDDPLLEVKTIGEGTVRHEYPTLLYDFTTKTVEGKTVVDLVGLWNAIKRPFPSHLRQAMLYLAITGRKRMVFIYECKWNQQTKEFVVKYRKDIAAPLLDAALDVKYGLESGRPPHRPNWAAKDATRCTGCHYYDTCYETEKSDDEEPVDDAGRGCRGEAEGGGTGTGDAAAPADVRGADGPVARRRVVRRRPDEVVRGADEVD